MARGPRVVPFPVGRPAWYSLLRTAGRAATPINDFRNAMIALRNDPGHAIAWAFDEMQQAGILIAPPPVCPDAEPGGPCPRLVTPEDVTRTHEWLQQMALPKLGREHVEHAIELFTRERPVHPLRDWLNSLDDVRMKSDWMLAQPILDHWLAYALGVPQDAYHNNIGKMFAVAMVARIMKPGCQADYMLVLEGPVGGEQKSKFCRTLAGDEYFSDHLPNPNDPVRLSMHLRGKWIVEESELASFTKVADFENLKAIITRREEIYVPKYGRKERREPRQCLFIGTTNDDEWIKGTGGSRRFWPIKVANIDIPWLEDHRDQLFAEAVDAYNAGIDWWPDPNFERRVIAPQQERRQWHDSLADRVNEIVETISETTLASLGAQLGFDNVRFGMMEQKRVATILKKAGWSKFMGGDGRIIWRKPE